ncbi:MAG: DUF86 domain-containing protein, partial [Deltaproteobacteria bacterium]|nr:DUF86 domain-containing protein [Deltaproteobacteria bacterium]
MDGERGKAILAEMGLALDALDEYARTVDFKRFTTDRMAFDAVLHAMTLSGQCAIDLALMIVADRALGLPPTYREAFDVLARNGVIPADWMEPLGRWASIRNLIVHLYTKLDLQELHEAYTTRTGVLRDFRTAAARLLAASVPPGPSRARERAPKYRVSSSRPVPGPETQMTPNLPAVARRFGLTLVVHFGSSASGRARDDSD